MIEIRIPKEIRTYKEKLFFGLNLRQLICTIVTLIINVPLYWYGRKYIGDDAISWIVIFTSMPLFLIGFFNYNGLNFEQFIIAFIESEFIYPKKRIYKGESLYEILINHDIKEEKRLKKKQRNFFIKIRGDHRNDF